MEKELKAIEEKYLMKGIDSPEKDRVLNEELFQLSKILKCVDLNKTKFMQEKNGEIWIQEALLSFCKTLMSKFPLEITAMNKESENAKNSVIKRLKERVTHDDTFSKLKLKLDELLEKELNQIKLFNVSSEPVQEMNANEVFDIFLSYSRKNKDEVKGFREKLAENRFTIWHDDLYMSQEYGTNINDILARAIKNSKIFLFIYNFDYKNSPHCMREFNWACNQRNVKILSLELEQNTVLGMQFALANIFCFKIYKINRNCNLSDIPKKEFDDLIRSINNLLERH